MDLEERSLEAAERFENESRDRRIERIRQANARKGDEYCIACGDPIGVDRRMALPSAVRCIDCQQEHERKKSD